MRTPVLTIRRQPDRHDGLFLKNRTLTGWHLLIFFETYDCVSFLFDMLKVKAHDLFCLLTYTSIIQSEMRGEIRFHFKVNDMKSTLWPN
jgi:hypothetical protein